MEKEVLRQYTETLMNVVIKKINDGEIDKKELGKKLNYKQKSLNYRLKGFFINIEEAIKICEAAGINPYDYVDIEKLNKTLLNEYSSIYSRINDYDKLILINDIEIKAHTKMNERMYKPSKKIKDVLYRLIYVQKYITIDALAERINFSPMIIENILKGESSFILDKKICQVLGLNCDEYIDYESMKSELEEGEKIKFNDLNISDKLGIIDFAYLLCATEAKDPKQSIKIYTSKN